MATGNFIPSFHTALGTLQFATSAVAFDENTKLAGETFTYTIINCKDITVTPPKQEVELINLLGQESTTCGSGVPATGSFQNAIFNEKSASEGKITCTLILTGDETNLTDFLVLSNGVGKAVVTNTYHRYTFGDSTSSQTRNTAGSVLLALNNGAEEVNIVLNNPLFNMGELKPTGMDGYFEVPFEGSCLAKDFAMDIKD